MESDRASPSSSSAPSFSLLTRELVSSFDSLAGRTLILFGGKGGVGKTTLATLAALHFARKQPTVLFSTDPASNLQDLLGAADIENLTVEQLDAERLYSHYLDHNLSAFLELGDRGTYFDRDEIQRLFELAVPGIDELMSWLHIGDLVLGACPETITVVDTAPTGHTLRMLASGSSFQAFGQAIEAMQQKHRELVAQLTRRDVRDALDEFLELFQRQTLDRLTLLRDRKRTAFVPVFLAEPWVVAQTVRLIGELKSEAIDVPFAVLNQKVHGCLCSNCLERVKAEVKAFEALAPLPVVPAPRSCAPLDSGERLLLFLDGREPEVSTGESSAAPRDRGALSIPSAVKLLFFAGKGGVGKTSCASSVAIQLAMKNPAQQFTLLSIDPAHSVRDVFTAVSRPPNLNVEAIDTRARWNELRESLGNDIRQALDGLTPSGLSLSADEAVAQRLIELAPPGADELFAVMRLHELLEEQSSHLIIVDTAPTGHFLRFIDLPQTAAEWVREFMRILLRYRDLLPTTTLGEQLLNASRALRSFAERSRSEESAVVVVTRPERIVVAETLRLLERLHGRELSVLAVVVNHISRQSACRCDRQRRDAELASMAELGPEALVLIDEQAGGFLTEEDLLKLVPLLQTAQS